MASSSTEAENLGTGQQGISSTFNQCSYSTSVPELGPPSQPFWNNDVRATASFQCSTAGTYNPIHYVQLWNRRGSSWDNHHVADTALVSLAAGEVKNILNTSELQEAGCYRTSMLVQKFDPVTRVRIWSSPAILSGGVSLGAGCPGTAACVKLTCAQVGANCGTVADGCGGTMTCGTCGAGDTCGFRVANVCGGSCNVTCASAGAECGSVPDGCGFTINCGACPGGAICGSTNRCQTATCQKTTCAAQGAQCGYITDGCGGTLGCGSCAAGTVCDLGNGGTPNKCVPLPTATGGLALSLTVTGRSGEKVTSAPTGLSVNVGSTGTANFTSGTSVKLTASSGRTAIWSGACSSNGSKTSSCTFTLKAAGSVTANIQ